MIDFDKITDTELLVLLCAGHAIATSRGLARPAAAQELDANTMLEAHRVRERQRVVDFEREEQERWRHRKGIAQAVAATGWDVADDQLVAWVSATGERRVFLQKRNHDGESHATLFVTGGAKGAPGSCRLTRGMAPIYRAAIPPILRAVAARWHELRVDLAGALAWGGEAIPLDGIEVDQDDAPARHAAA
jgi:hypothetical protein